MTKSQIPKKFASKYETKEYEKSLKGFPKPKLKEKYKVLNGFLIACVVILFLFNSLLIIGTAFKLKTFELLYLFLIGFFLPIAVIVWLLSYRLRGYYQGLLLGLVSVRLIDNSGKLFTPETPVWIGVIVFQSVIILMIMILSIYLWKKIYPDYKLFSK